MEDQFSIAAQMRTQRVLLSIPEQAAMRESGINPKDLTGRAWAALWTYWTERVEIRDQIRLKYLQRKGCTDVGRKRGTQAGAVPLLEYLTDPEDPEWVDTVEEVWREAPWAHVVARLRRSGVPWAVCESVNVLLAASNVVYVLPQHGTYIAQRVERLRAVETPYGCPYELSPADVLLACNGDLRDESGGSLTVKARLQALRKSLVLSGQLEWADTYAHDTVRLAVTATNAGQTDLFYGEQYVPRFSPSEQADPRVRSIPRAYTAIMLNAVRDLFPICKLWSVERITARLPVLAKQVHADTMRMFEERLICRWA